MKGAKKPVLVIEDDDEIRSGLREILSAEGYRVRTAANGKEALQVLRHFRPGLVFLDLMMPVMSGWEFLEAAADDLPIIVVSAYIHDAKSMSAAAQIHRPVGFMTKPVNLETILDVTHAFCDPYGGGHDGREPTAGADRR